MLSINDLHEDEYNELQYAFLAGMIDECFRPLWEICYKAKRNGNNALLRELHNYAVGLAEATKPTPDGNDRVDDPNNTSTK